MKWKFAQNEECYYINHTRHIVEKSRAYHSLRGRITGEELYTIIGCARMDYRQPYKTFEEATDADSIVEEKIES